MITLQMTTLPANLGTAPADTIFLEPVARAVLIFHAIVGFVVVFSCTHHAVYSVLSARGAKRAPQLLLFGWIAPLALSIQVLFGLVLYPTYRVRVANEHFSREGNRWLSHFFDLKEHAAAISLVFVLGAALVGRAFARDDSLAGVARAGISRTIAVLSITGATLVWAAALIGLYITARHPVGTP